MTDLDDLIAEAREQAAYLRGVSRDGSMPYSGELLGSLADALESVRAERDAALARIAELEATVDAQDRQIEARSGETAAERMFKEELLKAKARIAELEAELEVAMRPHSECERSGAEAGERIVDLEGDLARAEARIAEAAKLHRKAHAVFSWATGGVRYEDPCPDCDGKAGVHGCGCWADVDIEYHCAGCDGSRERASWPCPTAVALGLNEGEN